MHLIAVLAVVSVSCTPTSRAAHHTGAQMLFANALSSVWCWMTAAGSVVLPCARSSHMHPLLKFQAKTQQ